MDVKELMLSLRCRAPLCSRPVFPLARSCRPALDIGDARCLTDRLTEHAHKRESDKHHSPVKCLAAKVEEVESVVQDGNGDVAAVLFDMDGVLCNSEELSRKYAPG